MPTQGHACTCTLYVLCTLYSHSRKLVIGAMISTDLHCHCINALLTLEQHTVLSNAIRHSYYTAESYYEHYSAPVRYCYA